MLKPVFHGTIMLQDTVWSSFFLFFAVGNTLFDQAIYINNWGCLSSSIFDYGSCERSILAEHIQWLLSDYALGSCAHLYRAILAKNLSQVCFRYWKQKQLQIWQKPKSRSISHFVEDKFSLDLQYNDDRFGTSIGVHIALTELQTFENTVRNVCRKQKRSAKQSGWMNIWLCLIFWSSGSSSKILCLSWLILQRIMSVPVSSASSEGVLSVSDNITKKSVVYHEIQQNHWYSCTIIKHSWMYSTATIAHGIWKR